MEREAHHWRYSHLGQPRKRVYVFGEEALEDPASNNVLIIDIDENGSVLKRIQVFEEGISDNKKVRIRSGEYHEHRGGLLLEEGYQGKETLDEGACLDYRNLANLHRALEEKEIELRKEILIKLARRRC